MKKYVLLLFAAALVYSAPAQISIQPVLPFAGIVQKSNLWNIAVINTSTGIFDCRLELVLRNRATGLEVLTATTGQFQISPGAKQLNASLLIPVQYNYMSGNSFNRSDDFLPIGDYTACYRLTANSKNLVAEECASFDVEPLSPPMLINPADSSKLNVQPSQFSWIAPAPMNLFSRLQYEVLITEILPGQKAEEAMQQNLPFYTEPNISVNNLSYNSMASQFEKDKWYAWQVVARDDNNYAGKSEVWVFKITPDSLKTQPENDIFLLLDDGVKGTYTLINRVLHIKYLSQNKLYTGKAVFTDQEGKIIHTIEQKINQGENYFDFKLGNQFKSNTVYGFTIYDNQNKMHTLSFSLNK